MQNKVSGKPDAGEFLERLAKEVHASWRDGMLKQGRPVSELRMKWETLDRLDHDLDRYIAARVQRKTLLWAARHFRDKYVDKAAYLPATELDRLAESCGRK